MHIEIEEISSTKKKLTVEIPEETVATELDRAYRELGRSAEVPGFRRGKVPRAILKKRFGRDVESNVIEKILPRSYEEALTKHGLTPVSEPVFDGSVTVSESKPLSYAFTVEVRPPVDPLVYEGLELTKLETEPTEDEYDRALTSIRQSRAVLKPADKARKDDRVTIDYEVFEGETRIDAAGDTDFHFIVGMDALPKEFSEAVTGTSVDDKLDFTVTFPETHPGEAVAGKTVRVKGVVKEIKRADMPEIDDAFAKDQGFDSAEELIARVRENVSGMKAKRVRRLQMAEAAERLLDANSVDLPEGMLERELGIVTEEARAAHEGVGEAGLDEEALRAKAEKNVRGFILMDLIAERENLQVNDEDLKQRLAEISLDSGIPPEELVKYYSASKEALGKLRSGVLQDKVLGLLVDRAKLVERNDEKNTEAAQ